MKRSDFLQRLIGIAGFGAVNLSAVIPKRKIYLQQFFIAGFKHYKGMELLDFMQENDLLELRREPNNEYDNCAIALYWQQEKIGYVPAEMNELLSRLIDAQALPLLGMITHLNKLVKPWEKVTVAIYFLQDNTENLPAHAQYLNSIDTPTYSTSNKKQEEEDLYAEVFENYNGIVHIESIELPEIKKHFEKYYTNNKNTVSYNKKLYAHITSDDIYSYMYNVHPLRSVIADNGEEYVLFEFIDYP